MKLLRAVMIIIICGFLVFIGCANEDNNISKETNIEYREITPEEVKEKEKNNEEFIILDVRTDEEYKEGHIKGSIHIPVAELEERAIKELKDKNEQIFIYCRTGNRSETASKMLIKLKYKNVYDLGGIYSWPYETEINEER